MQSFENEGANALTAEESWQAIHTTMDDAEHFPRVWVGMVALGYVLFGIMHRPMIAVLGLGFAAAFYIPEYLLGDVALAVSGSVTLAMTAAGFAWVRKTGEW